MVYIEKEKDEKSFLKVKNQNHCTVKPNETKKKNRHDPDNLQKAHVNIRKTIHITQ